MSQTVRRILGSRRFLLCGLILLPAVVWAYARGQNNNILGSTAAQPIGRGILAPQSPRSGWECKKFTFGPENVTGYNTVRDLEGFLQTASQATITSSGAEQGTYVGLHYDIIACRQP